MFHKVKANMTKCPSTHPFKSSGETYGHGANARFSKKDSVSYGHYCSKPTKTAAKLQQHYNEAISKRAADSVKAIDEVLPKIVRETTMSLKVVPQMDVEMHMKVCKSNNLKDEGLEEQDLCLKHYISAHFNSNTGTEIEHTNLDLAHTLLGVPQQLKLTYQLTSRE
eukprot:5962077-Ditylum_brightwellii.AAC.1